VVTDVAGVLLSEPCAVRAAIALNAYLHVSRRNGQVPDEGVRQAAAELATAVPWAAVKLPSLLEAAGPQAAAAVKAHVGGSPASKTASRPVYLRTSEAADAAGVTGQAIRAACNSGRLVARKSTVIGEWQITPADLQEWMETRRAA
jgi:Helix-turn-helix domain